MKGLLAGTLGIALPTNMSHLSLRSQDADTSNTKRFTQSLGVWGSMCHAFMTTLGIPTLFPGKWGRDLVTRV